MRGPASLGGMCIWSKHEPANQGKLYRSAECRQRDAEQARTVKEPPVSDVKVSVAVSAVGTAMLLGQGCSKWYQPTRSQPQLLWGLKNPI